MTELCWQEKSNQKYCKNYKLGGRTKCKHHHLVNSYLYMYLMILFLIINCILYYHYSLNKSAINSYIYMSINNVCKNINKLGYNICIYLENYKNVINLKYKIYQYDFNENFKVYMMKLYKYDRNLFNTVFNRVFNYTIVVFQTIYVKIIN